MDEIRLSTEGGPQTESASALLSSLNPETVVDEAGTARTIFSFPTKEGNRIKTLFYSPEELPLVKTMEGKLVYIFGNKPTHRLENEWREFLANIAKTPQSSFALIDSNRFDGHLASHTVTDIQKGREKDLLLVEASPAHLLDFALALGAGEEELKNIRSEFARRKLSPQGTEFLDKIIAAKIVDEEGNFKNDPNYEGEVLTILALLGNVDAQMLLKERLKRLQEIDQRKDAENAASAQRQKELPGAQMVRESLQIEKLAAVHLTSYLPKRENGNPEIISTFDATNWQSPRNTVHFTLNHPVKGHFYGGWDSAPYAIIAPFGRLNEANGKPVMLSTVDTIYEVSPGTTLRLPEDTVIVKPGKLEAGKLWELDGNEVLYKGKDLTPEDIREFEEAILGGDEVKKGALNAKIVSWLEGRSNIYRGDEPLNRQDVELFFAALGIPQGLIDMLGFLEKEPISDVIEKILAGAGVEQRFPEALKKELVGLVEGIFVVEIKENAIRGKIEEMGYPVFPGGNFPWDIYSTYGESLLLAAEMGIPVNSHEHHITGEMADALLTRLGYLGDAKQRKIIEVSFRSSYSQLRKEFAEKFMPRISQKSRRMTYLLGVI